MPDYVIEDTYTGIRVPVEGDSEPTEDEAGAIIREEISQLSTNLIEFPGGKYVLDAGPFRNLRIATDRASIGLERMERMIRATDRAVEIADEEVEKAKQGFDWSSGHLDTASIWKRKYDEVKPGLMDAPQLYKSSYDKTAELLPENTLVLEAHGSESGGLYTEWGHEFTLQNVGALLGERTNSINTIVNRACFGGKCKPQDWEGVFPNVGRIYQTEDTVENTIGIDDVTKFFGGDAVGTNWIKTNGEWVGAGVPPKNVFEHPHYLPQP